MTIQVKLFKIAPESEQEVNSFIRTIENGGYDLVRTDFREKYVAVIYDIIKETPVVDTSEPEQAQGDNVFSQWEKTVEVQRVELARKRREGLTNPQIPQGAEFE